MSAKPKILVARLGAIGDICMLIPLVFELQRHFEVHWLIHAAHAPIVQRFEQVECRLIGVSLDLEPTQPFPDSLVDRLQREDYAALIDFSHWPSIRWLATRLQAVPVRAITQDPEQDALLGIAAPPPGESNPFTCVVPIAAGLHQVEKWALLVRQALGIDLAFDWPLPPQTTLPTDRPLRVFLHAHAGKPEKIWPVDRFAAVLAAIGRRQPVICTINAARRSIVNAVRWRLLFSRVRTRRASLDPTFEGLRQALLDCDIAIGCDSGPMHFAALLGRPTLIIFGRYPAAEFAPRWRATTISPPLPGQEVDAIESATVEAALAQMIARLRGPTAVPIVPEGS